MLAHDQPRQILGVLPNEFAKAEENRRALPEWNLSPALEGVGRRRDRAIDIGGGGERHFRAALARRGVVDGAGAVGGPAVALTGNPVVETDRGGRGHARTIL